MIVTIRGTTKASRRRNERKRFFFLKKRKNTYFHKISITVNNKATN